MTKFAKIAYAAAATPIQIAKFAVKRLSNPIGKPPIYLFGFNTWKTFMGDWFPDSQVIFTPMNMSSIEFDLNWKWRILADRRSSVLAWQYKGPPQIKAFCERRGIPFHYVEDGFIRSISLGALHTPPISMVLDKQDMFFNANGPTDLEDLLATYDFDGDPGLMSRARTSLKTLLSTRLSKYNSGATLDINTIYGKKERKRVLVIGQVERDASIAFGCSRKFSNNDLVWLARRENPDAQVIYKPHPEVMAGTASAMSNPDLVRDVAQILDQNISLPDSMDTIDHVYTITSLSGFEALLRGLKVTTVGCPFYSGWGLTDDRQPNPRRVRKLTAEQIFAAAYILYPKYLDPTTRKPVDFERSLEILSEMRQLQLPT